MPKFRYVGDDEREVPALRLVVKPGDTFEVDDDAAKGLAGQSLYEPVDAAKAAAKTAPKAPKDGES